MSARVVEGQVGAERGAVMARSLELALSATRSTSTHPARATPARGAAGPGPRAHLPAVVPGRTPPSSSGCTAPGPSGPAAIAAGRPLSFPSTPTHKPSLRPPSSLYHPNRRQRSAACGCGCGGRHQRPDLPDLAGCELTPAVAQGARPARSLRRAHEPSLQAHTNACSGNSRSPPSLFHASPSLDDKTSRTPHQVALAAGVAKGIRQKARHLGYRKAPADLPAGARQPMALTRR